MARVSLVHDSRGLTNIRVKEVRVYLGYPRVKGRVLGTNGQALRKDRFLLVSVVRPSYAFLNFVFRHVSYRT